MKAYTYPILVGRLAGKYIGRYVNGKFMFSFPNGSFKKFGSHGLKGYIWGRFI